MSGFWLFITFLAECVIAPFAIRERMRMKAASKRKYTGQRNRWQDGAR